MPAVADIEITAEDVMRRILSGALLSPHSAGVAFLPALRQQEQTDGGASERNPGAKPCFGLGG